MTIEETVASLYTSPEEVRYIANIAHNIPGFVFIIAGVLILLAGLGYRKTLLTYSYAGLLFVFSTLFTSYIFVSNGIGNTVAMTQAIWHYPEISIHLVQSFAVITGSLFELLHLRRIVKNKLALLAFPALFIVLGYTNILHPHGPIHNEQHAFFHSLLGGVQLAVGIFLIIHRLLEGMRSRVFLVLGVCGILISSLMLFTYREAPNAYEYTFPAKASSVKDYVDLGSTGVVYIYKDYIVPQNIKIKKGGRVKFILIEESWHDMASGPHPLHTDYPPLNIGFLKTGESKIVTFPETGLHGFHDHINENNEKLQGTIMVTD